MPDKRDEQIRRYQTPPDVPEADGITIGECEGCGGGVILFLDENDTVIAKAHLPVEPDDWLDRDFIPALRAVKRGRTH